MNDAIRAGGILHGGDLASARARYPHAPEPWIDLSTGISPHSYPVGEIPQEVWARLPGHEEIARLEAIAAAAWRVPADVEVVAAPGTQALIQLLPRIWACRTVAILGFTYQEHARAWAQAGAAVRQVDSLAACLEADVAVVVNPNNPDGRRIPPRELATFAAQHVAAGGLLVVDEAFADLDGPEGSLASLKPPAGTGGVLVLRSFGKTYGLAGIRLGFAIAGEWLAARIRTGLGPWAVSGPAIAVASRALSDDGWLSSRRDDLAASCARLDALLARAGFEIVGGTLLFRLAEHAGAGVWHEKLAGQGILTRPFPDRPAWLRFGIPGTPEAWSRLAEALDRPA